MFNKEICYKNAIKILRLSSIFKEFMLLLPVMVLVFQEKGVSVGDFFLIQGSFFLFVFLLEIPTGYIGDLFSRKKVLLIASFMMILAYIILYLASGLWSLILLEFVWALSVSLDSGTKDAYLYDILQKNNRKKYAIKESGKLKSYTTFGTAIAVFIGGFVYSKFGLDILILVEIVFMTLSFILLMFIPELEGVKRVVKNGKSKLKDITDIVKYAISHDQIKLIIIFASTFFTAVLMLMWGMQPLMEHSLIPFALFGIFIGLYQVIRAIFAKYSNKIFNTFKMKGMCFLLYTFLFLGFVSSLLILQVSQVYLIYFLLTIVAVATATYGCMDVVMTTMINHRIKSDERATVLSVNSMARGLFSGLAMIICKFIIDGFNLQAMYLILAPIILLIIFISMKKLLKLELK